MLYDEPYHSEIIEGLNLRLVLEPDMDPQDPREEDCNATTMVCLHGRYNLGDEHNYSDVGDFIAGVCNLDVDDLDYTREAHEAALNAAPIVWLPLYLYDHSGITMNTTGFNCPWDSGQVGIVYMTYDQIAEAFAIDRLNPEGWEPNPDTEEKAKAFMRAEVKTYDQYLTNDVYGYIITKPEPDEDGEFEELDSCWGFYGEEAAKEAGHEAAKALHSQ